MGAHTEPIRGSPSESTLVVEHLDVLVTMDEDSTELSDAWVAVDEGAIVGLGTGSAEVTAGRHVDGRGLVAIPGLVNTHHHFFQTLTRVLPATQDSRILEWLATSYPFWARIDEEAVYTTVCVAIGELLLSGCTTSSDHLYAYPRASGGAIAMLEAEITAARDLGTAERQPALRCLRRLTFAASTNSVIRGVSAVATITIVCGKVLPIVDHVNALKGKSFL